MILLYYGGAAIGLFLLIADAGGALRAAPRRVIVWRSIAVAVAAFVGLAPLVADLLGRLDGAHGLNPFVFGYLGGAALYAAGILAGEREGAEWLRRAGYGVLLVLAFLPSWVLIAFAPAIGLAGIGLVRPSQRHRPRAAADL